MDQISLITCAITTYKTPINILSRAINSVLNQTYKNIEVLLVNDAPEYTALNEQISAMLMQYPKIKYIVLDQHSGSCMARNTAIHEAHGVFIAFLDDDDEWHPTKLEKQIALMESHEIGLVYCSHIEIKENLAPVIIEEELARIGENQDDFERLLCENYIGSTSYPLLRLDYVKEAGGFNSELMTSQDYELWLKITKKHKIRYLPEPLVNYHVMDNSISSNWKKRIQGFDYILSEFEEDYLARPNIHNYKLNYLAFVCIKHRKFIDAIHYYIKGLSIQFFSSNNLLLFKKIYRKYRKILG